MQLQKIKDVDGFEKDSTNSAVLSVDNRALYAYKEKRKNNLTMMNEINNLKKLFEVNPNPNTINASNTVTGGTVTSTGLATAGSLTINGSSGAAALNSANTNVAGGTLLITSNTNINGTLLINGAAPGSTDDALAFAIALG